MENRGTTTRNRGYKGICLVDGQSNLISSADDDRRSRQTSNDLSPRCFDAVNRELAHRKSRETESIVLGY